MRRAYVRLIDLIAAWMTSPVFVGTFFGLIVAWIAWNTYSPWRFDPPPYMGLNLVMSALAGIQATTVAVASRKTEAQQRKLDERLLHIAEATQALVRAQHRALERLAEEAQQK
ncbi:MAG: DUF1003 domain-containing protein [Sphaerobacter sp.]|nr:DUF1003 domain-containing protein [Sphaerobacter sp.]